MRMTDEILPADSPEPTSNKRASNSQFNAPPIIITGEFSTQIPIAGGSFVGGSSDGGSFAGGSLGALRRYLLVRVLGRSVINTVQWSGITILLLAALCWLGGIKVLAVLIAIVAIFVLLTRVMLSGLERRLSGSRQLGAIKPRVDALVTKTRRGLRREFRRVGLPGVPWAPMLIALRLIRPTRRVRTIQALSRIDLAAVVPASQLDELHLILQSGGR